MPLDYRYMLECSGEKTDEERFHEIQCSKIGLKVSFFEMPTIFIVHSKFIIYETEDDFEEGNVGKSNKNMNELVIIITIKMLMRRERMKFDKW